MSDRVTTNDWGNVDLSSHLSVNVPLDRVDIWELGRKGPYHRFVTFPDDWKKNSMCLKHDIWFSEKKGVACYVCKKHSEKFVKQPAYKL